VTLRLRREVVGEGGRLTIIERKEKSIDRSHRSRYAPGPRFCMRTASPPAWLIQLSETVDVSAKH